jgi:hypothetical protein
MDKFLNTYKVSRLNQEDTKPKQTYYKKEIKAIIKIIEQRNTSK